MKILIIDNFDSFTFNLYQIVGELVEKGSIVEVHRNNAIFIEEIRDRAFDKIILSPGPGHPADREYFGVCADVLLKLGNFTPILGVCLGMQGMAVYFGGEVIRAKTPMHGKTSLVKHDEKGVFTNLPQNIEVMRYHSLVAKKENLPESLEISALSVDTGEIMGLRHVEYPIEGIQFHPESFGTEGGKEMIRNFLEKNI